MSKDYHVCTVFMYRYTSYWYPCDWQCLWIAQVFIKILEINCQSLSSSYIICVVKRFYRSHKVGHCDFDCYNINIFIDAVPLTWIDSNIYICLLAHLGLWIYGISCLFLRWTYQKKIPLYLIDKCTLPLKKLTAHDMLHKLNTNDNTKRFIEFKYSETQKMGPTI